MRKWHARLGDRDFTINADDLRQAHDYVSMYAGAKLVALLKLSPGDSVVEVQTPATPQ